MKKNRGKLTGGPMDQGKTPQEIAREVVEKAIESNVETIYFNGFTNTIGLGDVMIVLQRNGKAVAVLNASYTVAKTLAIKLGEAINFLEDKTSQKMLTTDQVQQLTIGESKNGDNK